MKLSMKTDYALRAIFTLVEAHEARHPIPIRELARRNDIPKKFLEHILLEMKAKGWVDSIPGTKGGYILAKSPSEISMGQIVRHFDGVLSPIHCVSIHHYQRCSQEPLCRFRRVMLDVRNYVVALMEKATLDKVFAGKPVSHEEVFSETLVEGAGI